MDFRVLGLKASDKWRCTASLHSLDTKKQALTMPCLLFVYKSCWTLPSSQICTMKAPISMDGWMDGFAYKKIQGCMDFIFSLKPFVNCKTTINMSSSQRRRLWRQAWPNVTHKRQMWGQNTVACFRLLQEYMSKTLFFSPGIVYWVVVMSIWWLEHINLVFKL